jgi:hypothetical protein
MLAFLLCLTLIVLAALLWLAFAHRPPRKNPAPAQRPLAQAQARGLEPPTHLNGPAFAQLLRAAKGDRSQVEAWILAEQSRQAQLDREHAIELVAAKLEAFRSN